MQEVPSTHKKSNIAQGVSRAIPPAQTSTRPMAALVLGIASLVLALIPFVGFGLGLTGLILSLLEIRKKGKTKEGYAFVAWVPWATLPGLTKAALVVSMVAVFGPILVLVFILGAASF